MSYSKLNKSCSDHAVGIAQVNQFGTNLQALHDLLAVEHGTVELAATAGAGIGGGSLSGGSTTFPGGAAGAGHDASGHHDTPLIPRGLLTVKLAPLLDYGLVDWTGNQKLTMSNVSNGEPIGLWYINCPGLVQMWGRASILVSADSSTFSPASASCVQAYDVLGIPGLIICTYAIGATNTAPWALSQQPFSVVVYGNTRTPNEPTPAGLVSSIRRSLGPRRRFPWFRRPG